MVALNDPGKPLRSKLLAVPALKAKYLAHVKTIAQDSLDWNKLGPIVAGYQALIEKELEADTRKLSSIAEFRQAVSAGESVEGGREARSNLRKFADERRKFLLEHPAIKGLDGADAAPANAAPSSAAPAK